MRTRVSVVVPVYYNEDNLLPTWEALSRALTRLPDDHEWEVTFVDDGSGDGSYGKLVELHNSAPDRVRVIKFTRNFGQVAAILAGIYSARGDCCVVISADLQDPPELIPQMVQLWNGGARKIVLATRTQRQDGILARITSRIFYRLMRRFAVPNMPESGFDFFLIDRQVMDIINHLEERNTFIQGHILWTGFAPETIQYTRRKREVGKSRWTLSKKLKYFIDGFVTYSYMPIRLIALIGLCVSLLSFAYAMLIFFLRIFWGMPVQGFAPTMITILMLSGIQLVLLGIIGEYVWRNYGETRKLPNYVTEETLDTENVPSDPDSAAPAEQT